MSAAYDASYRPGLIADGDSLIDSHHRSPFFQQQSPTQIYEINDDDDASGDNDPTEYSSIQTAGLPIVYNIGYAIANMSRAVVQSGSRLFYQQRQCIQMGEGPGLLRFLCFLGGFVMLTSSVLSIINVFTFLISPSTYVLQLYQGFFGVVTMVVEAKNWDCFDHFKPWMTEWFRFLTVPAGKGAFYLFVGSLGVSLWLRNFFSFVVGLYMVFMGIICVAVHAGTNWKPQLDQDHNYLTPMQHEDQLTSVFHDPENVNLDYDEDDDNIMRRDTTTTSSGHSLINKNAKNGKRYITESSSISTLPMNVY